MNTRASFSLNGCDTFMLAMDAAMRRDGSCGNVCHLLLSFSSETDLAGVAAKFSSHPAFKFTSSLRLTTPLLRAPRWKESKDTHTAITFDNSIRSAQELENHILSHKVDARTSSPFGCLALPHYESGPSLLFFWHHALCDAHGGELLVKLLSSSSEASAHSVIPTIVPAPSLRAAFRRAHRTKRHIFTKAKGPLARFTRDALTLPSLRYQKIRFSSDETAAIDALSKKLTGGMFPTALYLAATTRAATSIDSARDLQKPLFIPVPYDIRRATKQRSPLSNQVSFVFFRIVASSTTTLSDATNEIIAQLHDTIAGEHQHGMLDFLRFIRRLPSRAFWRIIEQPAQGHPASLYFSDIGSSLSSLESVQGTPVSYATHYPPIVAPPGLTTVWSRYRGNLEVTICYDTAAIPTPKIAQFEEQVRRDLLGDST